MNWIRGDDAGACYQGDNASTWSTTSDERIKREIVDSPGVLDKMNQVRIRNFRYVEAAVPLYEEIIEDDGDGNETTHQVLVGYDGENRYGLDPDPLRIGVVAQELQTVFPEAVKDNQLGHLVVNPDVLNWNLIKAVQELSERVVELEASQ